MLLRYLKQELDKGASIGELAAQGRDDLLQRARVVTSPARIAEHNPFVRLLDELVACLDPLDKTAFERRLNGAVAIVPFEEALHGILIPLQERVGELWHAARLSIAVEHYVSKLVQQKLFSVINQLPIADHGPKVIVACPPNETHELGALTVAYHCAVRGCRVIYLGGDTPIEDLAGLCRAVEPVLVLLSLTLATQGNELRQLLQSIEEEVAPLCPVGIGGLGIETAGDWGEMRNVVLLDNMDSLDRLLDRLLPARSPSSR
ncbi:hypothetical protein YTPLAS18_01000 [Nitrospira sp.]|nr:hypothetical protein YTPLAS18_01000 [Nitrospira sp.]